MASNLGKRKRRVDPARPAATKQKEEFDEDATARALFQKAFEAKFKPLHTKPTEREQDDEELEEDEAPPSDLNSDWSGISHDEDEDEDQIEIVEHIQPDMDSIFNSLKNSKKSSYLSSKPPAPETNPPPIRKPPPTPAEATEESTNLQHDLALQRLLRESHLLDPTTFNSSSSSTTHIPSGTNRLRALDLRARDLGAKTSALDQPRMPLAHRRGIVAKAAGRELRRRREAAENGIVLERVRKPGGGAGAGRRERAVGAPAVGKLRGSTLRLSASDVRSIQGGKKGRGGGRR